MEQYLETCAWHFGVSPCLRLETTVTSVVPTGKGWEVTTNAGGATYDRVVANGVFCEPSLPEFLGRDEFEAAGGKLLAGSDFHDIEDARGRHVLVAGHGKSACDVTVPISEVAATTDVIARQLLWKVPRKIAGFLNFKMLLLTRVGEALFRYRWLRGLEKVLHGPANGLCRSMLSALGSVSVRQFGLAEHGLVPTGQMEDIVKGAIGLATEGFFESVADGAIRVHRDMTIVRLLGGDRPLAELADGSVLPADLVVCATGFTQGVPFLPAEVQERLLDERGNVVAAEPQVHRRSRHTSQHGDFLLPPALRTPRHDPGPRRDRCRYVRPVHQHPQLALLIHGQLHPHSQHQDRSGLSKATRVASH